MEVVEVPIATPEVYAEMLDRAKEHSFAFPAINCTSSETINAAIKGFADAGSDGIIQFSTGGAEFGSGLGIKDMVTGAVALAEFAHVVAAKYGITVALHTDHCPKDKLDTYVRPLIAISQERVDAGKNPLFQSHMWDGSAVPIDENLEIAKDLLAKAAAAQGRTVTPDAKPERALFYRADHFSFAKLGVPMLSGAGGEDLVAGHIVAEPRRQRHPPAEPRDRIHLAQVFAQALVFGRIGAARPRSGDRPCVGDTAVDAQQTFRR